MVTEDFEKIYRDEINELKRLSVEIRKATGHGLFVNAFPKTCAKCMTMYDNADTYYRLTKSHVDWNRAQPGADHQQTFGKEFRICGCGAPIFSLTASDRRIATTAGFRRRELFDKWFQKLIGAGAGADPSQKRAELRQIFRFYESAT